jgi:hypothetical protein
MIPDKETRETKIEGERHRAKRGNRRGESRCICNFAVDRACVLCWRPVAWTAECKMRKNRSLEKGDRIETRSGKKLNPRDSIGVLYALLCHGQFLSNYSQRRYEKSRTCVRQPNGRRCWKVASDQTFAVRTLMIKATCATRDRSDRQCWSRSCVSARSIDFRSDATIVHDVMRRNAAPENIYKAEERVHFSEIMRTRLNAST